MKLKAAYATETYISKGGYFCIKQKDPMGGDDSLVMLTKEQVELVAQEIHSLLEDPDWWNPEEEDSQD